MQQAPGYRATASLYPRPDHVAIREVNHVESRVVPAQGRSLTVSRGPWFGVVDDCPRGERLVYVPEETVEKICTGTRPVYDQGLMMWTQVEFRYVCGYEFVAAHWECHPPTLRVIT